MEVNAGCHDTRLSVLEISLEVNGGAKKKSQRLQNRSLICLGCTPRRSEELSAKDDVAKALLFKGSVSFLSTLLRLVEMFQLLVTSLVSFCLKGNVRRE